MHLGQLDPEHQIQDFNPGIEESGLFWTTAVPEESVTLNLAVPEARFRLEDFELLDSRDAINALTGGKSFPGTVSFDLQWTPKANNGHANGNNGEAATGFQITRSEEHQFALHYIETDAAIEWSGRSQLGRFVSDPADTSEHHVAFLGFERNGVFFS